MCDLQPFHVLAKDVGVGEVLVLEVGEESGDDAETCVVSAVEPRTDRNGCVLVAIVHDGGEFVTSADTTVCVLVSGVSS